MLFVPSIFGNDVDDWMDDFDRSFWNDKKNPLYGKHTDRLMKTDVRELETGYEVDVELPGFKKEEIKLSLEKGNLTISAQKGLEKDETDKKGKVIRKERFEGNLTRSFYVGENLEKEDITAKYENGVLTLTVPKKEAEKLPEKHLIQIAG